MIIHVTKCCLRYRSQKVTQSSVVMLEVLINGCSEGWRLISIQPPMLEDSNGKPVDEFDWSDMDACYETFDKDGYVFNTIFVIVFRKTRLETSLRIYRYSQASALNLSSSFIGVL